MLGVAEENNKKLELKIQSLTNKLENRNEKIKVFHNFSVLILQEITKEAEDT